MILLKMAEWLSQNIGLIVSSILNSQEQTLISNTSAIVPGRPLLSLVHSRLYAEAHEHIVFYNNLLYRGKTLKKEGQRFIFKDGVLLFAFNLNCISLPNMESANSLTLGELLSMMNLNGKNISTILEKSRQEGNHYSNCRNWSLSVNLNLNSMEIVISNRRVSRKLDLNECRIMKEFMGQGLKNMQSTIGNEFMPETEDSRSKGHKKSTKKVTIASIARVMDRGRTMKIEF